MARPTVFDPDAIVQRYKESDLSMRQVAAEFGCARGTVHRALRSAGLTGDQSRNRGGNWSRKFDWEEARRLQASGMTKIAIAKHLGVTARAVGYAINGASRGERSCEGCGRSIDISSEKCSACLGKTLVNRDEDGRVYCARCDTWKDPDAFRPGGPHPARGVAARCRSCETADRKARRHANPEATRAYDRERRRKKSTAGCS